MEKKQMPKRQENSAEKSEGLIEILGKANKIKEKIQRYIESNTGKLEEDGLLEVSEQVIKILSMGSESYNFVVEDISSDDIDRTQSMLCGPLYCSNEYPHPINRNGTKLIPILQIDLNWIGAVCGKKLGDGMLQLWFDHELTNAHDLGTLRLIPLRDMALDRMVEFDERIWFENNREWIPKSWIYPFKKKVKQITGVSSFGFTVPESDVENILTEYYYDSGGDFHEELFGDLSEFTGGSFTLKNNQTENLNCHLFGDFYPIQMSATDFFPKSCFVSITGFAGGHAQILRSPSGGFSFHVAN